MRNASSRRVIWTRTVPSTKKKLRNWSSSLDHSMAVQAEAMGRVGNVLLALIAHSDRNRAVLVRMGGNVCDHALPPVPRVSTTNDFLQPNVHNQRNVIVKFSSFVSMMYLLSFIVATRPLAGADWPRFLGPAAMGSASMRRFR